jgi:hypothetical protein
LTFLRFGVLAASFAALFVTSPAPAASPAALLAQYAQWRGGAAFSKLTNMDETGDFTDGGLTGPDHATYAASGSTWQNLHAGPVAFALTTAGTGENTNLSGQVLPLAPVELAYASADAAFLFPITGRFTLAPDENFAGQSWSVLQQNGEGNAVYSYLISPKTGALYGVRVRRNGGTELTTFSDWRMVQGVRLPFHIHAAGDANVGALGQDVTDFTVKSVSLNTAPAPAPLPDRVVPQLARNSSGWVPFQFLEHEIYLPITLNGHKVLAILDSGASFSVVDSGSAAAYGVHGLGHFATAGQGGTAAVAYAPNVTLSVGSMRLPGVTAGIIDLGLPGLTINPPLVAILGAEAFVQTALEIDYTRHRLRFFKSAGFVPPPGSVTLPLGTVFGFFTLPVSVDGNAPIPVILDLGNDGTFQLFPAFWQHHALRSQRPASAGVGAGVGGLVTYRMVSLDNVKLGSLALTDVPTALEPTGIDAIDPTVVLGNMGEEVFSRFQIIIDFPNRRISFIPLAGSVSAPFAHDLVGPETNPAGKLLKVIFVMPGSPAAKAGFVAGDELTAIDGKPVQLASGEMLDNAKAGVRIALTLKTGVVRSLVPKRFY